MIGESDLCLCSVFVKITTESAVCVAVSDSVCFEGERDWPFKFSTNLIRQHHFQVDNWRTELTNQHEQLN